MGRLITRILAESLDVLLPPRCPGCSGLAPGWPAVFCEACTSGLELAPGPVHADASDPHDLLASPFLYGGPLARAIVAFKHGGLPALGRRLADLGLAHAPPPRAELVVPVPLHPRRLAARGFNPAAVVARGVARAASAPWSPGLLVRVRDTPTQAGLAPRARASNVRSAFLARRPRGLVGRSVLLVDDVWTTGATARECASTLIGAGSRCVSVYTLARVG